MGRRPGAKTAGCLSAAAAAAGTLVLLALPAPVSGQESGDCAILCRPEVEIEPGVAVEPVFRSPRVAELEDGVPVDTARETTATEFEITLAVGIPTELPRTELGFDVTWTPFVETGDNPFTGRTAEEAGVDAFRDNVIEFAPEVSFTLLRSEETGGWTEIAVSAVDDISPAATPDAGSLFTHKLEFAFGTTVAPLRYVAPDNWLGSLEIEGALDYLATGVPQAGDEVPEGEVRYLDDGARWGISVVAIAPVAPLPP